MANKMAITLTTNFPVKNIKSASTYRGDITRKCLPAYNLQLMRLSSNVVVEQSEPEPAIISQPIIYIV
jgi:hypothetical protein